MAKSVMLVAPPPPPPFDTPDGLNPDAWTAFRQMMKECGKTVHRMPSSCELFLRQHLAGFDTERDLLTAALRRGVPDQVSQHTARDGYDEFLDGLAGSLATSAKVGRAEAKWAVEAWATALGKPPGYVAAVPVARAIGPDPRESQPAVTDNTLKWVMASITAAGGFLGAALGTIITSAALWVSFSAVDASFAESNRAIESEMAAVDEGELGTESDGDFNPGSDAPAERVPVITDAVFFLVLAIAGLVNGVIGGLGAGLGWLFGRGNERPWSGFAAAFGAAFGAGVVVSAFRIPFAAIGPGVAAFGAAFAAASRGGNRV